jgi:hypothetical protein
MISLAALATGRKRQRLVIDADFVFDQASALLKKRQIALAGLEHVVMDDAAVLGLRAQPRFAGDLRGDIAVFLLHEGTHLATPLQAVAAVITAHRHVRQTVGGEFEFQRGDFALDQAGQIVHIAQPDFDRLADGKQIAVVDPGQELMRRFPIRPVRWRTCSAARRCRRPRQR